MVPVHGSISVSCYQAISDARSCYLVCSLFLESTRAFCFRGSYNYYYLVRTGDLDDRPICHPESGRSPWAPGCPVADGGPGILQNGRLLPTHSPQPVPDGTTAAHARAILVHTPYWQYSAVVVQMAISGFRQPTGPRTPPASRTATDRELGAPLPDFEWPPGCFW